MLSATTRVLKHPYTSLIILVLSVLSACSQHPPMPPKYEFRAVWVATFHNIDWPSAKGLPVEQQQAEFQQLLDGQLQNRMNAVVVQVRPCGDAFYQSEREPWSEYLSGKQGLAPEPFYDPLSFMVEEAHGRNMEFHAWINPFRAVSHHRFSDIIDEHITVEKPEWFFQYGNSTYFDPGIPEVRTYVAGIVSDIARRYDIDGIHFDDYFYPYPIQGKPIDDLETFQAYQGDFSDLHAWRRDNIDRFVKEISDSLQLINPRIKLGISPSAVWRNKAQDPKGSRTGSTLATYDILHADVRKWVSNGWIDYVAPQCYFAVDYSEAPYENLLDWWSDNSFGKHVYIGQAMYKAKAGKYESWRDPEQIPNQLQLNRKYEKVKGSIFFSASSFNENPVGIQEKLQFDIFRRPALVPPMSWKDSIPPKAPRYIFATYNPTEVKLEWQPPRKAADGESATYYVIYRFIEGEKLDTGNPLHIQSVQRETYFEDKDLYPGTQYTYLISAVDRQHNESESYEVLEVCMPELIYADEGTETELEEDSGKK